MKCSLHYFNPTVELEVANGNENYQAPALLRKFENDLAMLPAYYANPNDFVYTNTIPEKQFIRANFFLKNKHIRFTQNMSEIDSAELGEIIPWGWSPRMHKLVNDMKYNIGADFSGHRMLNWKDVHRLLYSRETAIKLQRKLIEINTHSSIKQKLAKQFYHIDELKNHVQNSGKLVLKSPWSSSGRGVQILREKEFNTTNEQVTSGILKEQGSIFVEEYLDKQADMAFHFRIDRSNTIKFLGYSMFKTGTKGEYEGNYLPSTYHPNAEISAFLSQELINISSEILLQALNTSQLLSPYEGVFGVDAIIYKEDGVLKLQACSEINLRMNFGYLALELGKFLPKEKRGMLKLVKLNRPGLFSVPISNNENTDDLCYIPLTPICNHTVFHSFLELW